MGELIAESANLRLFRRETKDWVTYTLEGGEKPKNEDLIAVLEALSASAQETTRPVCVVLGGLPRPNSRMLAILVGLLVAKSGEERRVSLAGPSQGWIDMLEIVGVRSRFLIVDKVEDLTLGE